jgi:hypothetical protein
VPLVDINDRNVLELQETDEVIENAKQLIVTYIEEGFYRP